MATRLPPGSTGNTTEFVLHKSQQTLLSGTHDGVIDYAEKRLLRYAAATKDPQQRHSIEALLDNYRAGRAAVAWRRGEPVYVWVTRE